MNRKKSANYQTQAMTADDRTIILNRLYVYYFFFLLFFSGAVGALFIIIWETTHHNHVLPENPYTVLASFMLFTLTSLCGLLLYESKKWRRVLKRNAPVAIKTGIIKEIRYASSSIFPKLVIENGVAYRMSCIDRSHYKKGMRIECHNINSFLVISTFEIDQNNSKINKRLFARGTIKYHFISSILLMSQVFLMPAVLVKYHYDFLWVIFIFESIVMVFLYYNVLHYMITFLISIVLTVLSIAAIIW